jgi:uncharacterized phage infection (PIP) family protein YhgE
MATPPVAPAKKATTPRKTTTGGSRPVPEDSGPVSSGSDKLDALVRALDDVELSDQHSLNAFCEALRKLASRLAVETAIGSGQLTAGAKVMAKGTGNPLLMGLDVRLKMRKVTKALDSASDHLGDAAAQAVTAWSVFEAEFEEALNKSARKAATPRGFTIKED